MVRLYQEPGALLGVALVITAAVALLIAASVPLIQWMVDGLKADLGLGFAVLSFVASFAAPAAIAAIGGCVLRFAANLRRRRAPLAAVALAVVFAVAGWAAAHAAELTHRPPSPQPIGTQMWFGASLLAGLLAGIGGSLALLRAARPSSFATFMDEINETSGEEIIAMGLSDGDLFELWSADVPADAVAELLRKGQTPAQIAAAYRNGVPPALASGAL